MEICQMTLGQFNAYMKEWIGSKKTAGKKEEGTVDDLEMFNIMAGIPKKIVQKAP